MMAGRKGSSHRFFARSVEDETNGFPASDEFDESEVWGGTVDFELRSTESVKSRPIPTSWSGRKRPEKGYRVSTAASLPVNTPDWSKILKGEYRGGGRLSYELEEEDEEGEGAGVVIPPHELLWRRRSRGASFSVHEGTGRTLKGRDLSRVRNAIFEKTGFLD